MENKEGLEPAPITPSEGPAFELLGGTIKKVFGEHVIVAPSAVSAIRFDCGISQLIHDLILLCRCLQTPVSLFTRRPS